jgi:hypothetical protein
MPGPFTLVLISVVPGVIIGILCGRHFGAMGAPRLLGLKWAVGLLVPTCLVLLMLFSAIGSRGWVSWGQVFTGTLLFGAVNAIPAAVAYFVTYMRVSPPPPKKYEKEE